MHQIAKLSSEMQSSPGQGSVPLATPAIGSAPWTPANITYFTVNRGEANLDPPVT